MGKTALISHLRGKKHEERVAAKRKSYGIRLFTSHSKELDTSLNPLIAKNDSRNPDEPIIRWLNNSKVAERALEMLPHLRKYKESLQRDKKEILSYSYKVVAEGLNDKFMPVRLAFFCYVSKLIEPFLEKYQNDAPLAPYLYNDITSLLVDLMNIFVKKEVLEKETNIDRIDLNNNANMILSKNLKLGFAVKAELKKQKEIKEFEIKSFKDDCVTILNQALRRLEIVLEIFQEKKWIGYTECDELYKEFKDFCSKRGARESFKQFDRLSQKLDNFCHGNAFVERGFSINKEVIVENQLAKSLVAQRQVYDAIQALGGLDNIVIDKQMILKIRNARSLYNEGLKEAKKKSETEANENLNKRRLVAEIDDLKKKRLKIIAEKQKETDLIEEKIQELLSIRK
ncbi:dna-dependent protein kinase catalytic subunit-like protein [Lasius niger]|uniref:Dna-dependent protein kinase catalytic subunit-like protein n=1 Tax=Lasius niger TaxID=67767 RepID=A0A0J7MYB4_LASNI|nr:dna-dependent protein kinase catalytic subunit-like protein [Lasius niger]